MTLMDKLERKFGRIAIPNLMMILVGAYGAGYILSRIMPGFLYYLTFDPQKILHGQIWRLVTFIVYPNSSGLFLVLITCFIYISISQSLERIIGRFKLNFFLISGILMLDIMGFIFYFVMPPMGAIYANLFNPYYLYAMLFVLFALIFPDARFLLMFIIPVKGKWMVYITLAMYALDAVEAFMAGAGYYAWAIVFMIIAAILTLVLFLFMTGAASRKSHKNVINMTAFQRAKRAAENRGTTASGRTETARPFRHQCSYCKRTDVSHPDLEFRYCSKCEGNYEFCMEHLYTHVHVRKTEGTSEKG